LENISKNIRLITAPNPSPMTFKGTNTYIVGSSKDICIIDPGPNDDEHYSKLKTLLKKENASHILVTHSHLDHSPLATKISQEFSIPIYAHGQIKNARSKLMKKILESSFDIGGFEGLDMNFKPDFYLKDSQILQGYNWSIEVVYTPGHLADHLCFAMGGTNILFSGDIVMGWTSTLISPPDGDLGQYFYSLDKLLKRNEDLYLPGHGMQVKNAKNLVSKLKKHRIDRENQILKILKKQPSNCNQIAEIIYKNQPSAIVYAGSRNVLAHLLNLVERDIVSTKTPISSDNYFMLLNI